MPTAPEKPWVQKLKDLRERLKISQAELARRLKVSPVSESQWELGKNEPSERLYIELGRLVGDPECWWFWNRAGLSKEDVARVVPGLEQRAYARATQVEIQPAAGAMRGDGSRLKKRPDAVGVPLLKDAAAAGSPRLIEEAEVDETLIFPRKWCPHPEATTCIKITGDSMTPVLEEHDIVAVDTSSQEPSRLVNEMVAARDPHGAITIKWLRKVDDDFVLIPNHTSKRHPPVMLSHERGWKIIGQVLFSFRRFK